jgi:hypothetical protein
LALTGLAGALALTLAAGPGSAQDPLATVGYVQRCAQFQRVELAAGQPLRLGEGAELVLIEPRGQLLSLRGYDSLRDLLVNLSTGEPLAGSSLGAFQHYLNGSSHELVLRLDADATALVRGVWK